MSFFKSLYSKKKTFGTCLLLFNFISFLLYLTVKSSNVINLKYDHKRSENENKESSNEFNLTGNQSSIKLTSFKNYKINWIFFPKLNNFKVDSTITSKFSSSKPRCDLISKKLG